LLQLARSPGQHRRSRAMPDHHATRLRVDGEGFVVVAMEPYPAPPPIDYARPNRTVPGSAVWSMILGLISFVTCGPLTAIPAVILGHVALRKIQTEIRPGKGQALTGLIAGYVNIGIALLAIPFFVIGVMRGRTRAMEVRCAANLRQIALACQIYAAQNRG